MWAEATRTADGDIQVVDTTMAALAAATLRSFNDRISIGAGEAYVPLATRSHDIWRQLEAETGQALLHEVGSIVISEHDDNVARPGRTGFIRRSLAAAERYGIPHEILDAGEIRRRFPNLAPADSEIGYYEPGGGYLVPENCVAAQLDRNGPGRPALDGDLDALLAALHDADRAARLGVGYPRPGIHDQLAVEIDRYLQPTLHAASDEVIKHRLHLCVEIRHRGSSGHGCRVDDAILTGQCAPVNRR